MHESGKAFRSPGRNRPVTGGLLVASGHDDDIPWKTRSDFAARRRHRFSVDRDTPSMRAAVAADAWLTAWTRSTGTEA
jgi:hypothetical protein